MRWSSAATPRFSCASLDSVVMTFASSVRIVSCAVASSDSAERARSLVYSASRQLAFAARVMSNLRELDVSGGRR